MTNFPTTKRQHTFDPEAFLAAQAKATGMLELLE